MKYIATIGIERNPTNDDGVVQFDKIDTDVRAWDDIEAQSDDEAWVTTMVRLRTIEPNLSRASIKVERAVDIWPQM